MKADVKSTRCGQQQSGWRGFFLLVALIIGTSGSAMAQTQTYTWSGYAGAGYNGNWSNTANWTATVSPVSSSTTSFYINASTNNRVMNQDVATPFQLSTLVISSSPAGQFTMNGGALQIYGTAGSTTSSFAISSGTGPSSVGSVQTINNDIQMMADAMMQANYASLTLGGNIDLNGKNIRFHAANLSGAANPTVVRLNGVISDSAGSTANNVYFTGPNSGSPNGAAIYVKGNNSYTGTTTIYNVAVYAGNNNAFGSGTSDIAMGVMGGGTTNPTLLTDGGVNISRQIRVMSAAAGNTSNATIGGSTADNSTFSGNVILNRQGSTNTMTAQSLIVTATNSGRVDFTGNVQREAAALTTASDTLTKTGAGIVALNGAANNYLGTTSVNEGALLVNGTLASGGGAVSVAAGATLGGIGTINRAVTVADNGILSAGEMSNSLISQAGVLTLGGDLSLNNASQLNFNLGTLKDLISISGNLTLDGVLNVSQDAGFGVGTYRLFDYAGSLLDNGLTVNLSGFTGTIDTSVANQINLIVTVPEPSTMVLVVGGSLLLVQLGVRRRRALC
ncbi:MAG: hypothetical protein B9S32_08170 [Verrucomicrobia bacterium Tous-C9LFEB]|nr:MAG: hypothetical protein B9S32_08170 [Verrucomicrobia bacterium Tous-C9LFEB]